MLSLPPHDTGPYDGDKPIPYYICPIANPRQTSCERYLPSHRGRCKFSSKSAKTMQAASTMSAASTIQIVFFLVCSIGYNALSSAKIHNFALITKIFHFSLFTFHFLLYLCTRLNTKAATMAQLVEQRIRNAWVRGSSPRSGSQKAFREFC